MSSQKYIEFIIRFVTGFASRRNEDKKQAEILHFLDNNAIIKYQLLFLCGELNVKQTNRNETI